MSKTQQTDKPVLSDQAIHAEIQSIRTQLDSLEQKGEDVSALRSRLAELDAMRGDRRRAALLNAIRSSEVSGGLLRTSMLSDSWPWLGDDWPGGDRSVRKAERELEEAIREVLAHHPGVSIEDLVRNLGPLWKKTTSGRDPYWHVRAQERLHDILKARAAVNLDPTVRAKASRLARELQRRGWPGLIKTSPVRRIAREITAPERFVGEHPAQSGTTREKLAEEARRQEELRRSIEEDAKRQAEREARAKQEEEEGKKRAEELKKQREAYEEWRRKEMERKAQEERARRERAEQQERSRQEREKQEHDRKP